VGEELVGYEVFYERGFMTIYTNRKGVD